MSHCTESGCVFFWHEYEENGCFSNWYSSPFVIDDFCYLHVEQYIMAQKAKVFHDPKIYTKILRASSPADCKSLGKQVQNFQEDVWEAHRYGILKTALGAKFRQNQDLQVRLLETSNALLAEASPYDRIFGIGMTAAQAESLPPDKWNGQNLLGKALMEVRSELSVATHLASRIAIAETLTDQILSAPKYYFSDLKPSMLQDGLEVVYAITHQYSGEVLYVGRTKNLRQRLYNNHLMGPVTNARLKKYLIEDSNVPEVTEIESAKEYLRQNCYFQYLPASDIRKRGQIEGLLSFMLNVRYIAEEH